MKVLIFLVISLTKTMKVVFCGIIPRCGVVVSPVVRVVVSVL